MYFKTPRTSQAGEWEAWREGQGEAADELVGAHASPDALLDFLEARDR